MSGESGPGAPKPMKPVPQVTGRTIDFQTVVNSVEMAAGGRPGPKPYPVYQFGGGQVRKTFVEMV